MSLIHRLRFEVKLADLWIGAFWKRSEGMLDIWVCFVPCIPLHIQILVGVGSPSGYTQEEYELYLLGFGLGHPLVGEPPVTVLVPDHPAFQRGLRAGHEAFIRAGCPQISYEE